MTSDTKIEYVGHVIMVEDGGDYGAIAYAGFQTDEEAVIWASEQFERGTWHYARLAKRPDAPPRKVWALTTVIDYAIQTTLHATEEEAQEELTQLINDSLLGEETQTLEPGADPILALDEVGLDWAASIDELEVPE